ncbi:MAG: hypothetical protein SWH68_10375 [Thermodesulfobacteriota bacterium]|nr:hypothetical protein [Thermodesulfobacteriota bacterium]
MVDVYTLGYRFKRHQKPDSIFYVKTVGSEIKFSPETGHFNTLIKRYFYFNHEEHEEHEVEIIVNFLFLHNFHALCGQKVNFGTAK